MHEPFFPLFPLFVADGNRRGHPILDCRLYCALLLCFTVVWRAAEKVNLCTVRCCCSQKQKGDLREDRKTLHRPPRKASTTRQHCIEWGLKAKSESTHRNSNNVFCSAGVCWFGS